MIIAISEKINSIKEQIKKVSLVAVTKARTPDEIIEAIHAGIKILRENKVQEAESKYFELQEILKKNNVEFHFTPSD